MAGAEGVRAVPDWSLRDAAARIAARAAGSTGLLGSRVDAAFERLRADPRASSLRFDFAEGHFGKGLLIEVDPMRLGTFLVDLVAEGDRTIRLARWFLDCGIWRDAIIPVSALDADREIAALLDGPSRLEDAPAFRHLCDRMRAGTPEIRNGVALDTPERIGAYFGYYRALIDSIRRDGFVPRSGLPPGMARRFGRDPVRGAGREGREREIGAAIGAGGELVRMVGGRHRTAIAQRLALPRVPVQVRLVHVAWLVGRVDATGLPPREALRRGIRELAG